LILASNPESGDAAYRRTARIVTTAIVATYRRAALIRAAAWSATAAEICRRCLARADEVIE